MDRFKKICIEYIERLSAMNAFPLEAIKNMEPNALVLKVETGEISLLKSFGVNYRVYLSKIITGPRPSFSHISKIIKWEMGLFIMNFIVGPICRFVLWCILLGGKGPKDAAYWQKKRAKAVKLGKVLFPDYIEGESAKSDKGLIIGFNHPSLHEILSLIVWSLSLFPDRRNNFPTNLPWYESICSLVPKARKIGIYVTPLITQNTFKKLEAIHAGNDEVIETITKVSRILLNHYFDVAVDFGNTGDNTFTAPSAARQKTIFPSLGAFNKNFEEARLLPAMSGLILKIVRANRGKKVDLYFLPVTIVPPPALIKKANGLELFRRYKLVTGMGFTLDEAKKLGRDFDYEFLRRIADNAPASLWYPTI